MSRKCLEPSERGIAHIYRDSAYLFSLQVNGSNRDFWTDYVNC